jgi:hypothetical protein
MVNIATLPAKELTDMGYRRISNRYRIISRIDRPDWIKWLEDKGFMISFPLGSTADFYRRVFSKDKIEGVKLSVYKKIPPSGHDYVGYVILEDDNDNL